MQELKPHPQVRHSEVTRTEEDRDEGLRSWIQTRTEEKPSLKTRGLICALGGEGEVARLRGEGKAFLTKGTAH